MRPKSGLQIWLGVGWLACVVAVACDDAPPGAVTPWVPVLGETRLILPGAGVDPAYEDATSNNNLDVVRHNGAVYLAIRSAPHHFADPEARIHVFRSDDEVSWTLEASFHQDTDLREPRLLSWDGTLRLYFARLGTSRTQFEPQGSWMSLRNDDGVWTDAVEVHDPSSIPWRLRIERGEPWMIGYVGGDAIYEGAGGELEVQVLTTADGVTWTPALGPEAGVLRGGGSEADALLLSDGRLVAVVRNENGDDGRYGSLICTADATALDQWTCDLDLRKFDSPLVFLHRGTPWLIARRQIAHDGNYDLDRPDMRPETRHWHYQLEYWTTPKRCALWRIDPDTREVHHAADLPSRGDTCFPGVLEIEEDRLAIYNYSSPIDGPDVSWRRGQNGPTLIYRTELAFQAP